MRKIFNRSIRAALAGGLLTATAFGSLHAAADDHISGPTVNLYGGYLYIDDEIDFDPAAVGGLGLGYRFDSPWELELRHHVGTADRKYLDGDVDLSQSFLNALYHMGGGDKIQPYWMFGIGHQDIDDGTSNRANSTLLDAGFGLKWAMSDRWSLRSDLSYISDLKSELSHALATLGLHYQFGTAASKPAPKPEPKPVSTDDDADGVPNQFDRCPGTGAGVTVDANGCEIVLDDDNDGVANNLDKCAGTSSGAKVDSNGCYILITETKTIELYVTFRTNSADLLPESLNEIDSVADFMRQYPLTQVLLEGHTDDRGSAAYNLELSKKRARSVANYLVERKGIAPSRVSSTGYGESRPAYPNDTKENLARNRRVTAQISAQVEQQVQ